jgi:ATP-binding cassette subfamily F protein uup
LPDRIAALEAEVARLETALADAGFYARDRGGFEAAATRLGEAKRELSAVEERWLELADRAERAGRGPA